MHDMITDKEIDDFLEANKYLEGYESMVAKLREQFGAAAVKDSGEFVPDFFHRLSKRSKRRRDAESIVAIQRLVLPVLAFLALPMALYWLGWGRLSPFFRDAGFWISAAGCAALTIYSLWLATRDVGGRLIFRSLLLAITFAVVAIIYKPDMLLKIPKSPSTQH